MRIAVTGATGYIGQFVVAELLTQGHQVVAWARPETAPLLPSGVEIVEGRLDRPQRFEALLDGADGLVHAAFDHAPGRYRGGEGDDPERFLDVNLHGSLALLTTAKHRGVKRCVLLSTRAVYDGVADRAEGLDETIRTAPTSLYGAHKAAIEAFVAAWGLGEGWPITALRPTGVYGLITPFARSKWVDLIRGALAGRAPAANRVGGEVHGADVARAVHLLLRADGVAGEVYNCGDIALSDHQIAETARSLAGLDPLGLSIDKPTPPRLMRTDKLKALGWQPGGEALFEDTLAALIEKLR